MANFTWLINAHDNNKKLYSDLFTAEEGYETFTFQMK